MLTSSIRKLLHVMRAQICISLDKESMTKSEEQ